MIDDQFFEVKSRVESAFRLFGLAEVEQSLALLVEAETEARITQSRSVGPSSTEGRHVTAWVLLTRGALLHDMARYRESEEILAQIRIMTLEWESKCRENGAECFFLEFIQSSILLSKGYANRARFGDAIKALSPILKDVSATHRFLRHHFEPAIESEIDDCGEALGYFNLSSKFKSELVELTPRESSPADTEAWRNPLPLRGPVREAFVDQLDALERAASPVRSSKLLGQLELRGRRDALLQDWIRAEPPSIEAKHLAMVNLFSITSLESQLGLFETLPSTLLRLADSVSDIRLQAPQYVDLYRIVGSGYFQLGTVILNQECDNSATKQRVLGFATDSILTGLENLEESRRSFPMTQATALITCVCLNAHARVCEMAGNKKCAFSERARRDAILQYILRRDPHNERAQALWGKYEHSRSRLRRLHATEVERWNWSVESVD